jgi:hypothetical protein
MNKDVLNKLARIESNVQLAEVKVDLANINDFVKIYDQAQKNYVDFNKAYGELDKIKGTVVETGTNFLDASNQLNSLGATFKKQFEEIGLNYLDYPEFKKAGSLLKFYDVVRKMTDTAKQI